MSAELYGERTGHRGRTRATELRGARLWDMGPCPSTGFHGRLDPKEDLNILPDPVVHPVDADRGRQCRIDLEDRGDGFLAFLNIGDLMRERIDDYALPFGAALDVFDLKTNVWVGDNHLGL